METWSLIAAYFDALTTYVLCYSFFLEPKKFMMMVPQGHEEAVARFFAAYQFEIVTGTCYLGSFVGSKDQEQDCLEDRVEKWDSHISMLAKVEE